MSDTAVTAETTLPPDTITRLSDRLFIDSPCRPTRSSPFPLKGLARITSNVHALRGLLGIIQNDADVDPDIGRAAIESVIILCDTVDASYTQRDLGLEHTDKLLEDEKITYILFALLGDQRPSSTVSRFSRKARGRRGCRHTF